MNLVKYLQQAFKKRQAEHDALTKHMRDAVEATQGSVKHLQPDPMFLAAAENARLMQKLTEPVEILSALAEQNPAQQQIARMEQEAETNRRMRENEFGYMPAMPQIEEAVKARREQQERERQEKATEREEEKESRQRNEELQRQNNRFMFWCVVIGVATFIGTVAGILFSWFK
jgi:ElaB/YqjD/DUF883 family membrane-anchored ribosome-binding protein